MPDFGSDTGMLSAGDLLDGNGVLNESGYAFSQVKRYDRAAIKANALRIKEWDYYCFGDSEHAVALTIADNSYMSLCSVSVLDFVKPEYVTKSKIGFMSMGKLALPSSIGTGDVIFDKSGLRMKFEMFEDGKRKLTCLYKNYVGKKDFECEIELESYSGDNITVAVPFDKPKQFYYNTKVNCLRGTGWYRVGDDKVEFNSDAKGVLDWGRGVWPYQNEWYWSSLSTEVDGVPVGFNLGYGFGKPTATENIVFCDGKGSKLGRVKFDIPCTNGKADYMKSWKITDDEGRLNLLFTPIIDRKDKMRVLFLATDQHQVFGKFFGTATLSDGTKVEINDKVGFAEHVKNSW